MKYVSLLLHELSKDRPNRAKAKIFSVFIKLLEMVMERHFEKEMPFWERPPIFTGDKISGVVANTHLS